MCLLVFPALVVARFIRIVMVGWIWNGWMVADFVKFMWMGGGMRWIMGMGESIIM